LTQSRVSRDIRILKLSLSIFGFVLLLAGIASGAAAGTHRHHRHHRGAKVPEQIVLDLTPVAVLAYVVPDATGNPVRARFLRRMNLENGMEARGTRFIQPGDVSTRNLFILSVTQSLEGGFDSVNLYDKGGLSWGIMQWTAATGSLPPVLIYIKRRLMQTGQSRVWEKVFRAQGMEADSHGLIVFGRPLQSEADIRLAFRGSTLTGNYDPKVSGYWAKVMARAGRQPAIQQFQREYAQQVVDDVLTRPLPGIADHLPGHDRATVAALTGGDPYAQALVFALWTNNPRHAREYVADAARATETISKSDNPAEWGEGKFRQSLFRRCRVSRFGNWKRRAELIEARANTVRISSPDAPTPFERHCQAALVARKSHLLLMANRRQAMLRLAGGDP
jgi:hypothetical protein